jgi:hypothetical protein
MTPALRVAFWGALAAMAMPTFIGTLFGTVA